MRRLLALLLLCCLLLTGCAGADVLPDLRLLEPISYQEEPRPTEQTAAQNPSTQVDIWLDASQTMGGINTCGDSLYPHSSRKYREGGFHYRFENTVGWYETLLRCMLASAEEARVRLLRYGNERLPDAYQTAQGLPANASVRRDMLTLAIDPMPTVFSSFSGERMDDSLYALASPLMNGLVNGVDVFLLENPSLAETMAAALDEQFAAIQAGSDPALTALQNDTDYPLLYALENIDLSRLSVITCDPASIRRLTEMDRSGQTVPLLRDLFQRVFDANGCVGLYAFTLDYLGQVSSFATVDLAEPLIWGQLKYDGNLHQPVAAMPMPRTLLTLVIGQPQQVQAFTDRLNAQMAAAPALQELRGPQKGELVYTLNGQTVTRQPFGFQWEYTCIQRPGMGYYTQHTDGAALQTDRGGVTRSGSLQTVSIPQKGTSTLTLTVPLEALPQGVNADFSRLSNLTVTVQDALTLTQVVPSGTQIPDGAQSIALRDRLYLFTRQQGLSTAAFGIQNAASDGHTLQITLTANADQLSPGYYRLCLKADYAAEQVEWQTPDWVSRLNASFTNEQRSVWVNFSRLIHRYEQGSPTVPRQFQHAWGAATDRLYHGESVPDIPPLMNAPGLKGLLEQIQQAASQEESPFLRYVFDVFVTNDPQ
ncbi:MAG: hypothetical protein SOZ54_07345 [Candidatus Limiplasma sp.]|nr:hypothetical protein [Candidatus Limiplasma sp.]